MATGASPFEAIVLAAGAGKRFGGGKLTAPFGQDAPIDGALIDGALAAAFAAPVRGVTVVWGADEAVPAAAARYAGSVGEARRLRLTHNPDHAEGLGASLRTGIAVLPPDAAGAFVFLGDMPRVPRELAPRLAAALAAGAGAAAPVFEGRRGHPVLVSAGLFPALLTLEGDRGAGRLLDALGEDLALVPTADDGVLFDVDHRSPPPPGEEDQA